LKLAIYSGDLHAGILSVSCIAGDFLAGDRIQGFVDLSLPDRSLRRKIPPETSAFRYLAE